MSHAVFTIVTPLRRESLKALDAVLCAIAKDPSGNEYLRFAEFPIVHFASFVIFERETEEPLLVFESSVDGKAKPYLQSLLKAAEHGLDAIYGNVNGYETNSDSATKLRFFVRRLVTPNLFHVGTPALTVKNIQSDRDLRDALETDLDVLAAGPTGQPTAEGLWHSLADLTGVPPSLTTAWRTDVDASVAPPNVRWIPTAAPGRADRLLALGTAVAIGVALLGALAVVFGALLLVSVNVVIAGFIVFSLVIAVGNAILSGWPAAGLRFSWPAVRLMLVAAAAAFASGLVGKMLVEAWLSGWTPTLSLKTAGVLLALLGLALIGPGVSIGLSAFGLAVPSPEGDFQPLGRNGRAAILDAEDRDVQNHMSALVRIDAVWYRLWTLRIFLWLLHRLYYRVSLTKGKLVSIPTVHFAQWVLLDGGRFLFLSNYDHSWSRYLDDFGTRIGQGIIKLWGQGIGFPGIRNLSRFKEYARSTMVPHSVWYSAYPGLTVRQIWTNQKLRTDLFSDATNEEAAKRLARLAAADPL